MNLKTSKMGFQNKNMNPNSLSWNWLTWLFIVAFGLKKSQL